MPGLHFALHARPADTQPGPVHQCDGRAVCTRIPPAGCTLSFPRSFEQVQAAWQSLPRMFFEPDGAFVWSAADVERPWQIDGVVYDRDGRVDFVELRGWCPQDRLDVLLRALGWPETAVLVQSLPHGIYMEEAEFRRWLGEARRGHSGVAPFEK